MKRDSAENIIRQKVKGLEAQTSINDSDALWERLNTRLEETPKRRRFPLYYAAAALLLIVVCIAALMKQERGASKDSTVVKAEKRVELQPVVPKEEPKSSEPQTPSIAAEMRKLQKKRHMGENCSLQHMRDEESLEQMGKEADDGLYANPIASAVCNARMKMYSIKQKR